MSAMRVVMDSLAVAVLVDSVAHDAVASSWPAHFGCMTLTPIAEEHHKSAVALLEQARAQFVLASYWSNRGD